MDFVEQRIQHIAEHHAQLPPIPKPDNFTFPDVSSGDGVFCVNGNPVSIASYIDHTNLSQSAQLFQIKNLCQEAAVHKFASVCVNGAYASAALEMLKSSAVKVCCVVGFPLGNTTTESKVFETEQLVKLGVKEIDSVLNCGFMKDQRYFEVYKEILYISQVCHAHGAIHKVIIEATCLEDDALITDASLLCVIGNADFVKTSTGMHSNGGAQERHVRLMRTAVGSKLGIKAAGGIKSLDKMVDMIRNGASRIGASCGVKLVQGE